MNVMVRRSGEQAPALRTGQLHSILSEPGVSCDAINMCSQLADGGEVILGRAALRNLMTRCRRQSGKERLRITSASALHSSRVSLYTNLLQGNKLDLCCTSY